MPNALKEKPHSEKNQRIGPSIKRPSTLNPGSPENFRGPLVLALVLLRIAACLLRTAYQASQDTWTSQSYR